MEPYERRAGAADEADGRTNGEGTSGRGVVKGSDGGRTAEVDDQHDNDGGKNPRPRQRVAPPETKQRVVVPRGPAAEATSEDSGGLIGTRTNRGASSSDDAKPRPTASRAAAPGAVAVHGPAPEGGKVARSPAASAPDVRMDGDGDGRRRVQRIVGASAGPTDDDEDYDSSPVASGTGKPALGSRATSPGVTSVSGRGAVKGGGGGVDSSASDGRVRGMDGSPGVPEKSTDRKVAATPSTNDFNPNETMDGAASSGGGEGKGRTQRVVAVTGPPGSDHHAAPEASSAKPRVGEKATSPGATAVSAGVNGTGGRLQNREEIQQQRVQKIVAPSRPSDTTAIVGAAALATSAAKPEVVERATAPGAVAVVAATQQRPTKSGVAAKVASATAATTTTTTSPTTTGTGEVGGDPRRPRVQRVLSGRILPDATVDVEVDDRGKMIPAGPSAASSSPSSTTAATGTDAKPKVRSRATAAGAVAVAGIGSAAVGGDGATHDDTPPAEAASRPRQDDVRVQRTAELRCPSDTAIGIHDGGEVDGTVAATAGGDAADVKAKARAETKVRADAPGASSVTSSAGADVVAKSNKAGRDDNVGDRKAVVAAPSSSSEAAAAEEEMERKRREKIIAAARTLLNAGGANERTTIDETEAPSLSDDAVLEKVGSAGTDSSVNADHREQVVQTSAPSLAEDGGGGRGGGSDGIPAASSGDAPAPPPGVRGGGGGSSNPAPVSCELLVETSLQRGETPPADHVVATTGMPASPPFTAPPSAVGNRSVDGAKMGDNGYDTADIGVEAAVDGGYKVPRESTCHERHPFLCGRRMLCLYAFVVVAVAIIVPSVLLTGGSSSSGEEDGSSQSSAERVASFSEILAPISPAVRESGTPQNKALNWLATEDPARLSPTDDADADRIVRRYVLACLYYSTDGEHWGDQLYFLSGDHECRWNEWNREAGFLNGVTCHEGRVDYLMLPNNGLVGTIPSELQELSSMTRLALNSNLLSGTIPPELFNLTSLEHLGLQFNQLVGPISTRIGSLLDLTELNLSANTFNDTIPDSLGNLAKLELLVLHSNRLTGAVPDSFHDLESLETLHLYGNSVTGNVTYMCDMGVTEITADCFEVACSCPSCDCY